MEGLKVFAIWAFVVTPFFFMGDMMINDREKEFTKKVDKVLIEGTVQRKEVKVDEFGDKRYYAYIKDEPFLVQNQVYSNYPVGSKLTLVEKVSQTTNEKLSSFYAFMLFWCLVVVVLAVICFFALL